MTTELKFAIHSVRNTFWSGGISIHRLEDLQTLAEKRATTTRKPIEEPIFDGSINTTTGSPTRRWKDLREGGPVEMFTIVADQIFPSLRAKRLKAWPRFEGVFARQQPSSYYLS